MDFHIQKKKPAGFPVGFSDDPVTVDPFFYWFGSYFAIDLLWKRDQAMMMICPGMPNSTSFQLAR